MLDRGCARRRMERRLLAHGRHAQPATANADLDRDRQARECPRERRNRAVNLLSHFSPNGRRDSRRPPPLPGDMRLLALGEAAWQTRRSPRPAMPPAPARGTGAEPTPAGRLLLAALFGNSPFLTGVAVREWAFLTRFVEDGADAAFAAVIAETANPLAGETQPELMRRLRIARRRIALTVAAADLAGAWDLERQMQALTGFAEAALDAALHHLLRAAAADEPLPADAAAAPKESGLIVLGMGKLGGGELNYSSDIDLILLYDPARAAPLAREALHSLFNHIARELVRILDERTGDGYVFRTDLRLRPDPRSTPLVMSAAAALRYYESVGQNWERAALIKARPVAGDRVAGARFLAELQPYIWRRHLDFAAIADIHSIKRQIQAHRGGGRIAVNGHDIKVGRGGIREIEFFAQTQQLIWGGRRPQLRVGATCEALRRLAASGQIDAASCATLIDDYRFLRRVEHRLQMVDDAQTHRLPSDAARHRPACGLSRLSGDARPSPPSWSRGSVRSRDVMPSCSRRRRASPAPATSSSPAPMTTRPPWRPWRSSALPSRARSRRWCATGITAACARRAASGRARS